MIGKPTPTTETRRHGEKAKIEPQRTQRDAKGVWRRRNANHAIARNRRNRKVVARDRKTHRGSARRPGDADERQKYNHKGHKETQREFGGEGT